MAQPRKSKIGDLEWDLPQEIGEAEKALAGHGRLRLGRPCLDGRRRVVYELAAGAEVVKADELYPSFLLHDATLLTFWCSPRLAFEVSNNRARLTDAGVVILAGTLVGENRKVIRAEWSADANNHAQPHWHVYGSAVVESFRMSAEDYGGFNTARLDLSRFHFAMNAPWDYGDRTPCHPLPNPESFRHWLVGCLKYCQAQLEYLEKRAFHVDQP